MQCMTSRQNTSEKIQSSGMSLVEFQSSLNPDLSRQFFSAEKVMIYQKSPFFHGLVTFFLGKGIVMSEGAEWKRKRKFISQKFNFQYLLKILPVVDKCVTTNFELIDKKTFKKGEKQSRIYLQPFLIDMAGSVSAAMFFGKNLSDQDQAMLVELSHRLIWLLEQIGEGFPKAPETILFGTGVINLGYRAIFRETKACKNFVRENTRKLIQKQFKQMEHRETNSESIESILDSIFKWNKTWRKDQFYEMQDIMTEFFNLHLAASDTSSHDILMMLYYLDIYPEVKSKINEEIDRVYEGAQGYAEHSRLKELKYLDCFQKQTTRFYGPLNRTFIREATADNTLKDIPIWKGTLLMNNSFPSHYNPKYFKDPMEFKPERWMQQETESQAYSYIGFGGGPRGCIGKELALIESKLYVVRFLKEYQWNLEDKNLQMEATNIYVPKKAFCMIEKKVMSEKQME